MPVKLADTGARWPTAKAGKASGLHHQENVIVDRGGFIPSKGVTHAPESRSGAIAALPGRLPFHQVSLAGDSGYSGGRLRRPEERNITACIPVHSRRETGMV